MFNVFYFFYIIHEEIKDRTHFDVLIDQHENNVFFWSQPLLGKIYCWIPEKAVKGKYYFYRRLRDIEEIYYKQNIVEGVIEGISWESLLIVLTRKQGYDVCSKLDKWCLSNEKIEELFEYDLLIK